MIGVDSYTLVGVIQKEHGEKIQEVCQEGLTLAKECLEILDIMHQRQSAGKCYIMKWLIMLIHI
jgi:hypothetical protein